MWERSALIRRNVKTYVLITLCGFDFGTLGRVGKTAYVGTPWRGRGTGPYLTRGQRVNPGSVR